MDAIKEKRIRGLFERDECEMGANHNAMDRFIRMLYEHASSENESVRTIAENADKLREMAPNYTIFESNNRTFFMHNFRALQISLKENDTVLAHEFGHSVLNVATDTVVPEDFVGIVKRAHDNSLNSENKAVFIEYVKNLTTKNRAEVTDGEKCLSDIISAVFQYPSFRFSKTDNTKFILPAFHQRDYYFDEEANVIKAKAVWDECFANYYAMQATGATFEISIMGELFGQEFLCLLDSTLEKVAKYMKDFGEIEESKKL